MDQEIKTDQSVVTIEMAAEEINAVNKVDEPHVPEESPSNPQTEQPQNIELSTSDKEVIHTDEKEKKDEQNSNNPERDAKGKFLPGHNQSEGRPCEFCERPIEILQKVNLYREWCRGKLPGDSKPHIPYIEELVSEDYLDITYDQFEDWLKSENHKEQHKELVRVVAKLFTRQKLALLKLTLRGESARGAMFQLSANHKVVEASKQYQAGLPTEPLEYNIHIVPKTQKQIEQQDE